MKDIFTVGVDVVIIGGHNGTACVVLQYDFDKHDFNYYSDYRCTTTFTYHHRTYKRDLPRNRRIYECLIDTLKAEIDYAKTLFELPY